jgi:hypothetical protein
MRMLLRQILLISRRAGALIATCCCGPMCLCSTRGTILLEFVSEGAKGVAKTLDDHAGGERRVADV